MKPGDVVIHRHSLTPRTIVDVVVTSDNTALLIFAGSSRREDIGDYIGIEEAIEILTTLTRLNPRNPKPAMRYHQAELDNLENLPPRLIQDQDKEIERRTQIIKELENG